MEMEVSAASKNSGIFSSWSVISLREGGAAVGVTTTGVGIGVDVDAGVGVGVVKPVPEASRTTKKSLRIEGDRIGYSCRRLEARGRPTILEDMTAKVK